MLVIWLVVSHRVVSSLCHFIHNEKGKVLLCISIHCLTAYEPRDPNIQQQICYYHGFLVDALESENVGDSLDEYYTFIKYYKEAVSKGDPNEKDYKVLLNYLELDDVIENREKEKSSDSYYQYIGSEVVLPNHKGDKFMGKVKKLIKYDEFITG